MKTFTFLPQYKHVQCTKVPFQSEKTVLNKSSRLR
jgi:hypothetical protein